MKIFGRDFEPQFLKGISNVIAGYLVMLVSKFYFFKVLVLWMFLYHWKYQPLHNVLLQII